MHVLHITESMELAFTLLVVGKSLCLNHKISYLEMTFLFMNYLKVIGY